MKPLLITVSFLLSTTLLCNELSWVDEQVKAIKPPRSGMSINNLNKIKNPFLFLKKDDETVKDKSKQNTSNISPTVQKRVSTDKTMSTSNSNSKIYNLTMIMNNSFLINQKWYKVGSKIDGYTISLLNSTSILLKKKSKKSLLLTTRSSKQKLKFFN